MHAILRRNDKTPTNTSSHSSLLGHIGSPIGLVVTSLPFLESSNGIGVIVSVEMRMPFPSEPQDDTALFKVLFDNKYVSYSRLELESRYLVHSNRIHIPPEGIELTPNPPKEQLDNLIALMRLVHKFDYLASIQVQKQ